MALRHSVPEPRATLPGRSAWTFHLRCQTLNGGRLRDGLAGERAYPTPSRLPLYTAAASVLTLVFSVRGVKKTTAKKLALFRLYADRWDNRGAPAAPSLPVGQATGGTVVLCLPFPTAHTTCPAAATHLYHLPCRTCVAFRQLAGLLSTLSTSFSYLKRFAPKLNTPTSVHGLASLFTVLPAPRPWFMRLYCHASEEQGPRV